MHPEQSRTYDRASSVVFLKTDEPFGGLSNMAGGFTLLVNGMHIFTSEALYQACRFPHRPDVQRLIIEQKSPMTAKMKSKPYRHDSRQDWDHVRVNIMRWCLRVKLAQNWFKFSELLLETGERPIVEESRKDDFWGAKPIDEGTLTGMNVLGRLLMELREVVRAESRESLMQVQPIAIPEFLLDGRPIEIITAMDTERDVLPVRPVAMPLRSDAGEIPMTQPSLFDGPSVKEAASPVYVVVNTTGIRISDLKPYTEYKESGLPWLGQVPGHWDIKRAKSIFRRIDERSTTGKEELLTVSSARGIVPRKTANVTMFKAESYLGYKLCWPGDLVINSLWAWAGGLGVSRHHGIISSAYGVYRIRQDAPMNTAFVHELVRSSSFNWELRVRSKGVWISRLQLTDISYLDAPMHIPPPDEQAAIVRFLDWANGRLERAIRAKRKVIALLNEQKQAIIHHAVTRGLDPSVPLKSSGIPWLGDIPRHWSVLPMKRLVQVRDGTHDTPPYVEPSDRSFPLVTSKDFGLSAISFDRTKHISEAHHREVVKRSNTERGDVLMSMIGGNIGKAVIVDTDREISIKNVALFKTCGDPVRARYVLYYLQSGLLGIQIVHLSKGGAQGFLGLGQIRNLQVPMMPAFEIEETVQALDLRLRDYEGLIAATRKSIDLITEYRTRLVADVVTGKLDVREAAARLPVEAVETKPLGEGDMEESEIQEDAEV